MLNLKPNDIITIRNGEEYLIIEMYYSLYGVNKDGWLEMRDYDDDWKYADDEGFDMSEFDITLVRRPTHPHQLVPYSRYQMETIYEENVIDKTNEEKEGGNEMGEFEIKPNDIIKTREGVSYFVVKHDDCLYGVSTTGHLNLDDSNYYPDWTSNDNMREFDIMEIRRPNAPWQMSMDKWHKAETIFVRTDDVKKMTEEEISEALGYKVKVV